MTNYLRVERKIPTLSILRECFPTQLVIDGVTVIRRCRLVEVQYAWEKIGSQFLNLVEGVRG